MELDDLVGWLFYIQIILSCFNCLVRPDYNVAFALLFYYIWKAEKSRENIKRMLWLNAGLVVFDALWLLVTGYTWGQPSSMEGEALTLEGYDTAKRATIVSALINMAIKVAVVFILYVRTKEDEPASTNPSVIAMRRNVSPFKDN